MENLNFNALKARIKTLAKRDGKNLQDIIKLWNITLPGLNRRLSSDNFPYTKYVHELAKFLNCSVDEILGTETKPKQDNHNNEVNEPLELYHVNNSFDEKTLLHVLKRENLLLQQIIERQEKEIEFLRGQLMNNKG